jgi:hypothetical protein
VLVTANYKLTFDVVRRDAAGMDAWLYGSKPSCGCGG